jgi:CelD/BcsL family acetyltransferase involved in cellulose biosynthesis
MQTRPWVVACAETFAQHATLNVITIEDASGITAVAPMIRRRAFPPISELLGVRELSEPSDLVFRDAQALAAIIDELARDSAPILLERVPERSASLPAIRAGLRGRAIVISRPGNNCPYITLEGAAKLPDQILPGRLRSDLRRAQRKAESYGNVTYEIHAPRTAAEFLPLFEQAVQVEAAGWKGRGGSAVAVNQMPRAFFTRYGELASEEGILRLAFLRIDGVVTAMQYAVQWNGAFWLLKIGYDESFSKCSPGMLLIQHTLRYAADQGLHSYEFLGSAESWTRRWTTTELGTLRTMIYPFRPAGLVTLGRDVLHSLRRKVAVRLAARRRAGQAPEDAETSSPPAGAEGD